MLRLPIKTATEYSRERSVFERNDGGKLTRYVFRDKFARRGDIRLDAIAESEASRLDVASCRVFGASCARLLRMQSSERSPAVHRGMMRLEGNVKDLRAPWDVEREDPSAGNAAAVRPHRGNYLAPEFLSNLPAVSRASGCEEPEGGGWLRARARPILKYRSHRAGILVARSLNCNPARYLVTFSKISLGGQGNSELRGFPSYDRC